MIILDAAFISEEAIFAKSSDRGGTKRSVETTSFPCFGSHSQSFMDWENLRTGKFLRSLYFRLYSDIHPVKSYLKSGPV